MDSNIVKKLDNFFASYPSREYSKGEIIIQANVEPSGVFYITSGIVRNYWISSEGSEITLNMFKSHSFIPMSWVIANLANTHFYETMTNVIAKRAPKEAVITFLKKEPEILYDLLRRIYIGMEGLWTHVELLSTGNSQAKLVASLLVLVKRFGKEEKNGTVLQLKLSESDIASYAGISRETASRELQKLKKENLMSFNKGTLTIYNVSKLEKSFPQ